MLDRLKALFIMGVVVSELVLVGVIENQRTINATVLSVENDIVQFEDTEGDIWEYETTEGYIVGETVNLTFDMNGTDTIKDDRIINIRR